MSNRKNHNNNNATVTDLMQGQKAVHFKLGDIENTKVRLLDGKCGVKFGILYSTMIESDEAYQRPLDLKRVDTIVDVFDPRLVNPLKVSFRDGHYYIFDGAHTLAALKKIHKFESFPVLCMIFYGLNYADEAYLFALQTGQSKSVASAYRIRALAMSGDAKAVDFVKRVKDAGFRLAYTGSSAPNTFSCVDKLWRRYKEDPETFSEALSLLRECWHGEHWSLAANMFGGVFVFLKAYKKKYDMARFVKNLSKIGDTAAIEKKMSTIGVKDARYAFAMAQIYNKGGRKDNVNPYMLYDEVA